MYPYVAQKGCGFPSIKHQGLGSPSNYRPISNLSFPSKLLEKYVSVQLVHYLYLHPLMKSSFRKFHSTESLMESLLAKVFHAVDNGLSPYSLSIIFIHSFKNL